MTERKCCDDIIEAKVDIDNLAQDLRQYKDDAQRWRDQHEDRNAAAIDGLQSELADIKRDIKEIRRLMTTWVNPVISVVITLMGTLLGAAVAVIVMLSH